MTAKAWPGRGRSRWFVALAIAVLVALALVREEDPLSARLSPDLRLWPRPNRADLLSTPELLLARTQEAAATSAAFRGSEGLLVALVDNRREPLGGVLLSMDVNGNAAGVRTDTHGFAFAPGAEPHGLLARLSLPELPGAKITDSRIRTTSSEAIGRMLEVEVLLRGTLVVEGPSGDFLAMAVPTGACGPSWDEACVAFGDSGRAIFDLPPGAYQVAFALDSIFGFTDLCHPGDELPAVATIASSSVSELRIREFNRVATGTITIKNGETDSVLDGARILPIGPWCSRVLSSPDAPRVRDFLARVTGADGAADLRRPLGDGAERIRSKLDVLVERVGFLPVARTMGPGNNTVVLEPDPGSEEPLELCIGHGQEARLFLRSGDGWLPWKSVTNPDPSTRTVEVGIPARSICKLELDDRKGQRLRSAMFLGAESALVPSGCEDRGNALTVSTEGFPDEVGSKSLPLWIRSKTATLEDSWREELLRTVYQQHFDESVNRVWLNAGGEVETGLVVGHARAELDPTSTASVTLSFGDGQIAVSVGHADEGGRIRPIDPWVVLEDESGDVLRGRCGDDGTCRFIGLKPGTYVVQVEGFESVRGTCQRVQIDATTTSAKVDLVVPAGRTTVRGLFVASGHEAAGGARFTLHYERDESGSLHPPLMAIADSEGVFSFVDLVPGRYTVRFDGFGGGSARVDRRVGREVSFQVTSTAILDIKFD